MTDDELENMEADLLLLNKADSVDLELLVDDAEVMATLISSIDGMNAGLRLGEEHGRPPTPEDYKSLVRQAEYQLDHALGLLSASARDRLSHVLDDIRTSLSLMSSLNINANEMARRMAETIGYVEAHGGGASPDATRYTPYEWARLCRTEAAFARNEVEIETLKTDWGANSSAIDDAGQPPYHPHCYCNAIPWEGPDGQIHIVVDTTSSACELCNDMADRVLSGAGG